MRSPIPIIWLILHFFCLMFCLLGLFLFFKERLNTLLNNIALGVSVVLNLMITFLDLRITANIGQYMLNRLLLNYSFHVGTTSLVFLIVQMHPITWILTLGYSSFYQILRYLVMQILPKIRSQSSTVSVLVAMYRQLSSPPHADFFLAFLELINFFTVFLSKQVHNSTISSFVTSFYAIWYLLYRYSTNKVHQEIWNSISLKFVTFSSCLPTFIGSVILKFVYAFSYFGSKGMLFYQNKYQVPQEPPEVDDLA